MIVVMNFIISHETGYDVRVGISVGICLAILVAITLIFSLIYENFFKTRKSVGLDEPPITPRSENIYETIDETGV